jgi:hypothetical protein
MDRALSAFLDLQSGAIQPPLAVLQGGASVLSIVSPGKAQFAQS